MIVHVLWTTFVVNVLHERQTELKDIFHILVALSAMVKHHFRGTVDINMTRTLALLLWSLILPITLYAQGFNAVWMVLLISYFFLGLNIAGQKVGNAFVASEDAIGFQNVTGAQKKRNGGH